MRCGQAACAALALGLLCAAGCDPQSLFKRPVTQANAPPGCTVYTCQAGENPYELARRAYGKTWMAPLINRANDREQDDMTPFEQGEKIYLPPDEKGLPVNPARMATPYGPDIGDS